MRPMAECDMRTMPGSWSTLHWRSTWAGGTMTAPWADNVCCAPYARMLRSIIISVCSRKLWILYSGKRIESSSLRNTINIKCSLIISHLFSNTYTNPHKCYFNLPIILVPAKRIWTMPTMMPTPREELEPIAWACTVPVLGDTTSSTGF